MIVSFSFFFPLGCYHDLVITTWRCSHFDSLWQMNEIHLLVKSESLQPLSRQHKRPAVSMRPVHGTPSGSAKLQKPIHLNHSQSNLSLIFYGRKKINLVFFRLLSLLQISPHKLFNNYSGHTIMRHILSQLNDITSSLNCFPGKFYLVIVWHSLRITSEIGC